MKPTITINTIISNKLKTTINNTNKKLTTIKSKAVNQQAKSTQRNNQITNTQA